MKTILTKICLLGCLLLIAAPVAAYEPDVAALVSAAPKTTGHPETDAVMIYENTEYDIDADGRCSLRRHSLLLIQTDWAMRRLSDTRVAWDSSRQELDITVCRAHLPGGGTLDTPANGFNEVTPDAVARSAAFLDIREMVISHVGVEAGAVLELDYTIRDLAPPQLPVGGREFLQQRWPTTMRRVEVKVAPGVALHYETLFASTSWVQESDDGNSVTVMVREMPAVAQENNGAHRGDYVPSVVFGTRVVDLSNLARQLQVVGEIGATGNNAMKAWLDRADEDVPDLTDLDRVRRIAAFVGDELRTVTMPTGLLSRAPRPAPEVFASAFASHWEKALLTMTLLREAGLEPELGFVSRYRTVAARTPTIADFAELRVVVPVSGRNYWLAPGRSNARPGKCDRPGHAVLFIENVPGGHRSYTVPAATGSSLLAIDLRPDDDGFTASIEYSADGLLCSDDLDADDVAESLAGTVLDEAEVLSTEVLQLSDGDVHLRIDARGAGLAADTIEGTDGTLVLILPDAPHPAIGLLPRSCRISAQRRHSPLFMVGEVDDELRLRLQLPEEMRVDYRPADVELAAAGASWAFTATTGDGVLEVTRRLHLPGASIEASAWSGLRSLLADVTAPGAACVVLRK